MKLSIIITTYNVEKYIEECLRTIVPQLNSETELIIVDDTSTDETISKIANTIKDYSHIKISVNTKNEGVSYSRNVGLRLAIGDYVAFIDGDDYVSMNYVNTILKYLQTNKDYYVLSWSMIGELTNKYDSRKLPQWNKSVWSRIIKRSLIKHNFDETMSWAEDAKFIDENISKDMRCDYIKEYLYIYRYMRKDGITYLKMGKDKI